MRNYLKITEIEDIVAEFCGNMNPSYEQAVLDEVYRTANTCLCHAYSPSECTCGAWDSYDET